MAPKQPIVPFRIGTKNLCGSPLVFGALNGVCGLVGQMLCLVYLACDKGVILVSTVTLPQILRSIQLSLHEFRTVRLG